MEKQGYVFLCTDFTERDCLMTRLFGVVKKYLPIVIQINESDTLFLYNLDSQALLGVFEAHSPGGEDLEPDAWKGRFPAQVRAYYRDLRIIREADRSFPFLDQRKMLKLSEEQTGKLVKAFKDAPKYPPFLIEESVPDVERLFANFLDTRGTPYIRFSQEYEDFSKVLRDMKAKRPDFLVFTEKERYFVEVKSDLIRPKMPQLIIYVNELQRLIQLQLMSGVETLIIFPVDIHGTTWKPIRPVWVQANGIKRKINEQDAYILNIRKLEKLELSFLP